MWVGLFNTNDPESANLGKNNGDYNLTEYAIVGNIIFALLYFRIILSLFFRDKERKEGKKMRDRKWV